MYMYSAFAHMEGGGRGRSMCGQMFAKDVYINVDVFTSGGGHM